MDIGPTDDGRIVPIFEERLRQMGRWLAVSGKAIYASKPWRYQNDTVNSHVWSVRRMFLFVAIINGDCLSEWRMPKFDPL